MKQAEQFRAKLVDRLARPGGKLAILGLAFTARQLQLVGYCALYGVALLSHSR